MAINITQREKSGHYVTPVGIMKYILWSIFCQSIDLSQIKILHITEFMGNTLLEERVKYYHRVGNQQNPECEKYYRTSLVTLFLYK